MNPARAAILVFAPLLCAAGCRSVPADGPLGSDAFDRHVQRLANPAAGRSNRSKGWANAGQYIADHWRSAGLAPAGSEGSYFQHFGLLGRQCRNVVGILPSTRGDDDGPVIVVGAHYDHLPTIRQQIGASDSGTQPPVYPGADDNASGVAVLLMLAEALSKEQDRPATYVFVGFDAEEDGFHGSRHYVAHPAMPIERTVLMVNIDQVGRLRGDNLLVIGDVGALPNAKALLSARIQQKGMRAWWVPYVNTKGWSDQSQFASAGVKTIFLCTGLHTQYHSPADRVEMLNVAGAVKVAHYAYYTLLEIGRTWSGKMAIGKR